MASALIGVTALVASTGASSSALVAVASAGPVATPVVGGTPAKPGDWPDAVAVFMEDGSVCSGTLLAADLVLTAAHCIGGHPVQVLIGSVDFTRPEGDRRDVKWSKAYPNWEETYDVGVVMLENPVAAKQRALAENCVSGKRDRLATGTRLQVVGFGLTTATATDSNSRLHAATLAVVDGQCTRDSSCKAAVAPGGEFTAGGNGADACFGDSGGPVYIATSHGPALIGVVSRGLASWSQPCGEGGVFVRADRVASWVEQVSARRLDRVECDLPADDGGDGASGSGDDGDGDGDGTGTGGSCSDGAGDGDDGVADGDGDGAGDGDGVADSNGVVDTDGCGSGTGGHAATGDGSGGCSAAATTSPLSVGAAFALMTVALWMVTRASRRRRLAPTRQAS